MYGFQVFLWVFITTKLTIAIITPYSVVFCFYNAICSVYATQDRFFDVRAHTLAKMLYSHHVRTGFRA